MSDINDLDIRDDTPTPTVEPPEEPVDRHEGPLDRIEDYEWLDDRDPRRETLREKYEQWQARTAR